MTTDILQVATTIDDEPAARRLGEAMVDARLAACAQVSGPIQSIYYWQDQRQTSLEWMCVLKTTTALYAEVQAKIRELHSYDEPEIIAVPVVAASESYLRWVAETVKRT